MGRYSTFLFARPSFLEGVARVLDIGGTLNVYNASPTPELADYLAVYSDWLAAGADITDAMIQFAREYQEAFGRVQGKEAGGEAERHRFACQDR